MEPRQGRVVALWWLDTAGHTSAQQNWAGHRGSDAQTLLRSVSSAGPGLNESSRSALGAHGVFAATAGWAQTVTSASPARWAGGSRRSTSSQRGCVRTLTPHRPGSATRADAPDPPSRRWPPTGRAPNTSPKSPRAPPPGPDRPWPPPSPTRPGRRPPGRHRGPGRPRPCAPSPNAGGADRYRHTVLAVACGASFLERVLVGKPRAFQHSVPHDRARPHLGSTPSRPSPHLHTTGADRTNSGPSRGSSAALLHDISYASALLPGQPRQNDGRCSQGLVWVSARIRA